MEIINQTEFQFAFIAGRIRFPKHSLTLIVKGTFDLLPDKPAVSAKEQIFPTADEFYPEDKEMKGGPKYSSDFAYFKPKADLLLVGKFHSPQGKKLYSSTVKFQVGSKSKVLNISGNRYWTSGFSKNTFTDPEPFSEMELRYENSFGGIQYGKNPVGKGIDKIKGENHIPVPNILYPGELFLSPNTKLEPAGFGPLNQIWPQRSSKLGSYKGNYMEERWPWFAKDFDWTYFNTAPSDMQLTAYLSGDEKLYLENMHPVYAQYNSQLPGLKVRCFSNTLDEKNRIQFNEVKMNLDTLWIDAETEKCVLIWRGVMEIKNEDFDEVKNILIVSEESDGQAAVVEHYRSVLEEILNQQEEEFDEEIPAESKEEADVNMEKEIAEADEQIRASLIESGIDPDNPVIREDDRKREEEIFKQLGIEEESEVVPLTREKFIERANRKENFDGEDLRGLDLSGVSITGLMFRNSILANVSLKNSDLSNSDFTDADLSGVDLTGAKLYNAVMKNTDLTKAVLENADLTGAVIENAIFEGAKMSNALLNKVKGKNAFFSGADLTQAKLTEGEFTASDFSKSIFNQADFKGSSLREVSAEGASGIQADFSQTDLTGLKASGKCIFKKAIFKKAKGMDSIWEEADLTESDFSYSEMEAANFSSAMMQKANMSASNMKFARFIKADLNNARFVKMNLFQGSLEKADLTGTDFSGSNLYGVEFLGSLRKSTKFLSANLKMTKISNGKL